jgi:NAD(P)-dependent dehydrogenase (short-subunit alcohol dehydrogenase family)
MSRSSTCLAEGHVAVITGASSGIGRATARFCAKLGMKVFLADVDEEELAAATAEVAALAKGGAGDVKAVPTNVADPAAVAKLKEAAFAATGAVHFLMNNAGIGNGGGPLAPLADWERIIGVNTWGPIHGCQAFVPAMKASGQPGLIVNTGSKQGITMPPGNLAYNVSKAALKAYTEGLEHELRGEPEGKLSCALLVPGWVNTSIGLKASQRNAKEKGETVDVDKFPFHEGKPAAGAWMPDQIVDFMIQEIDKGRFYIMCPDNDVDRETDNLRMTWTMQDITQDRAPLSRWHPEYKDKFDAFLKENKKARRV